MSDMMDPGPHNDPANTGQVPLTSNLNNPPRMSVMKAFEHGFVDGDHLVIDGHEYSGVQIRRALSGDSPPAPIDQEFHNIDDVVEIRKLRAAVRTLLAAPMVADIAPEDRDPEDIEAESLARRALPGDSSAPETKTPFQWKDGLPYVNGILASYDDLVVALRPSVQETSAPLTAFAGVPVKFVLDTSMPPNEIEIRGANGSRIIRFDPQCHFMAFRKPEFQCTKPAGHEGDHSCGLVPETMPLHPTEKTTPDQLVGALQDVVHTDTGPVRAARSVKASAPTCGNPVMVNAEWYGPCTLPSGHEGDCKRTQKASACPKCEAVRKLGLTSCFEHKQSQNGGTDGA